MRDTAHMDLGLDGRVYIVTGASRGLGLATATALVAEGARVVLNARNTENLDAAAASIGGPDVALPIAGDLAEPDLPERLIASAHARFGRLDGAAISVGGPAAGAVLVGPADAGRQAIDSVFLGTVAMMSAVGRAAGFEGAAIVVVLSSSVRQPLSGLAVSNGLRPGLAMVAKSLADDLGPAGVRVNTLLPGRIDTDRVRELDDRTSDPELSRRRNEEAIPLGRYGHVDEFARVAAFLLSPAASYITGTALAVDGGFTRAL